MPKGERRVIVMRGQDGEWSSVGEVEVVRDDRERWREKRGGIEVGEGVGVGGGSVIGAVVHKNRCCGWSCGCRHLAGALSQRHHIRAGGASC